MALGVLCYADVPLAVSDLANPMLSQLVIVGVHVHSGSGVGVMTVIVGSRSMRHCATTTEVVGILIF